MTLQGGLTRSTHDSGHQKICTRFAWRPVAGSGVGGTGLGGGARPASGFQDVGHQLGLTQVRDGEPECPGSQQVIGQGAEITGGTGRVTLEAMPGPFPGSNRSHATAFQTRRGTTLSWSITSHLICVDPVVPGLRLPSTVTEFDSRSKGVTTSCFGNKVVGTGFSLVQGSGLVFVDEIMPSADLTTVRVGASEGQNGHPGVWSVRAFALCATP